MLNFKNFNVADWFSFYRIAAAPILLVLLIYKQELFFTWFLLFSFCTDAVDGYLAKKLKITSDRGSQLDSLGDQITFIVSLLGLWVFEPSFIKQNITLILIAFIPYGLQMLMAYLKYGKATAFHTYLAKFSAILQASFILISLFFVPYYPLFYGMLIIGLLETIEEIILILMYDHWASNIKGIFCALKDKRRTSNTNASK